MRRRWGKTAPLDKHGDDYEGANGKIGIQLVGGSRHVKKKSDFLREEKGFW